MALSTYELLDIHDSIPKVESSFADALFSSIESRLSPKSFRSRSPLHKRPRLSPETSDQPDSEPGLHLTQPIRIGVENAASFSPRKTDPSPLLSIVHNFISQTLDSNNPASSSASVYRACRTLILQTGHEETLSTNLRQRLERHVILIYDKLALKNDDIVQWLELFVKETDQFHEKIARLVGPLAYVDQTKQKIASHSALGTQELAYSCFQSKVLFNPSGIVRNQITAGFLAWIDWERTNRQPHAQRTTIQSLISIVITHGHYNALEADLLSHSADYFKRESDSVFSQARSAGGPIDIDARPPAFPEVINANTLLRHILKRVEEDVTRLHEIGIFLPGTTNLLKNTIENAFFSAPPSEESEGIADWISRRTLEGLIATEDAQANIRETKESVAQQYCLYKRAGVLAALQNALKKHVQSCVQDILKDTAKDEEMVERLLNLKSIFEDTMKSSFSVELTRPAKSSGSVPPPPSSPQKMASTSGQEPQPPRGPDPNFTQAMHSSFSTAFKTRPLIPAEQIAKALDREMRKGQGKVSQREYSNRLKEILSLYRYSEDKDVFRTFYHRALAKRLLLEKSASDDEEKNMLKFLSTGYDPEFGTCERMFKDLDLSRGMNRDFRERNSGNNNSYVDKLSVMVLQHSAWPFVETQSQTALLPAQMGEALALFEKYYKSKHENHRLRWDYSLGTVTLTARFKEAPKELSVSLYQTLVLLLFNEGDKFEYSEIKERVSLEEGDLVRTLQSLALGKKRVLHKQRPGKDVGPGDFFTFNAKFTDPRPKVHINSIQAKVTVEESRRTQQSIEGDRKYILEAAIVRIMKGLKESSYEDLLVATIDAVKGHFKPEVDVIKKRIESLVEQDYLERKPDTKNIFLYVA